MADSPPSPEQAFRSFKREIDILENAGRTGAPTQDPRSEFFGYPFDDFTEALRSLRDEIEARAYLAIVAASEAVLQLDFRARVDGRATVPLRDDARRLRRHERHGRRIVLEDVLDAWAELPSIRKNHVTEFKQLLSHRHWLAHGRYFKSQPPVPADPGFALGRARALLVELSRVDAAFPRG